MGLNGIEQNGRVIVGLLTACLVLAACGGNGDSADTTTTAPTTTVAATSVTVADLIGEWLFLPAAAILHLNEDGTYRIATGLTTVEQGQFSLVGTLFTFISNKDSRNCTDDQRGTYEMEVLELGQSGEDRLQLIKVEDPCSIRGSLGDFTLERMS